MREDKELVIEEEIEDNETIAEDIKPFNTKNIKVSSAIISLESLVKRLTHKEIDLNPDFQRNGDLWDKTKMSRLIESIILRLPLPIFYFDVSDDENWVVIDGLQRLSTIKKFIVENKLKLSNLEFLAELNGKKYTDLDRNIQRVIDETQIITYQVEGQTPKEVRYSIFNRINTGGLTLNPQEIRQALNQQNNGVKYLKEIAEDKNFINIVRIASKRMVDRELILRYFSFKLKSYGEFYESKITLSTFLDNTMEYIDSKEFTDEKYRVLKTEFLDTLVYLTKLFEKNTLFNKTIVDKDKTATLNRSLFEIWTVLISGLSKEEKNRLLIKKILLKEKYKSLLKTLIFEDAITKGTNDRKAVFSRFSQLKSLLEEVVND
ncbi:MAG: DUF262 domain-containing protein [Fusobacteriaceae bacterium]